MDLLGSYGLDSSNSDYDCTNEACGAAAGVGDIGGSTKNKTLGIIESNTDVPLPALFASHESSSGVMITATVTPMKIVRENDATPVNAPIQNVDYSDEKRKEAIINVDTTATTATTTIQKAQTITAAVTGLTTIATTGEEKYPNTDWEKKDGEEEEEDVYDDNGDYGVVGDDCFENDDANLATGTLPAVDGTTNKERKQVTPPSPSSLSSSKDAVLKLDSVSSSPEEDGNTNRDSDHEEGEITEDNKEVDQQAKTVPIARQRVFGYSYDTAAGSSTKKTITGVPESKLEYQQQHKKDLLSSSDAKTNAADFKLLRNNNSIPKFGIMAEVVTRGGVDGEEGGISSNMYVCAGEETQQHQEQQQKEQPQLQPHQGTKLLSTPSTLTVTVATRRRIRYTVEDMMNPEIMTKLALMGDVVYNVPTSEEYAAKILQCKQLALKFQYEENDLSQATEYLRCAKQLKKVSTVLHNNNNNRKCCKCDSRVSKNQWNKHKEKARCASCLEKEKEEREKRDRKRREEKREEKKAREKNQKCYKCDSVVSQSQRKKHKEKARCKSCRKHDKDRETDQNNQKQVKPIIQIATRTATRETLMTMQATKNTTQGAGTYFPLSPKMATTISTSPVTAAITTGTDSVGLQIMQNHDQMESVLRTILARPDFDTATETTKTVRSYLCEQFHIDPSSFTKTHKSHIKDIVIRLVKEEQQNEDDDDNDTAATTDIFDHETVVKFFRILGETYEGGYLDESCKEMIKKYPQLLDCTCPFDEGINLHGGMTAAECMCETGNCGARDTLVELVEMGAKATQQCYYSSFGYTSGYLPVLFYSGCLPLRTDTSRVYFLLDEIAANDDWVDDRNIDRCFKILVGNIKVGDHGFNFTVTKAGVERTKKLPKLQVGWTHANDGPFENFMKTNGYEKYLSINSSKNKDKKKKRKFEETKQQIKSSNEENSFSTGSSSRSHPLACQKNQRKGLKSEIDQIEIHDTVAINEKSEIDFNFGPIVFFKEAFRQSNVNENMTYKLIHGMPGAQFFQASIKLTDGTIISLDHPCMKDKALFSYENYVQFQEPKRRRKCITKKDAKRLLLLNLFFYYEQEHAISWLNNLKEFRDCSQLRVALIASRMSPRVHMLFQKHRCGYSVVSYNTKFEIMHECFLHKNQDLKHDVNLMSANGYAKEDKVGTIGSSEEFRTSHHDNQQETTKLKQIVTSRMTGNSCTQYAEEISERARRSSSSSDTILLVNDDNADDNLSIESGGDIEIIKVAGGRSSRSKAAFNKKILKANDRRHNLDTDTVNAKVLKISNYRRKKIGSVMKSSEKSSPNSANNETNEETGKQQLSKNTIWKKLTIGSKIGIFWQDDNCYYPCRIERRENVTNDTIQSSQFFVRYDDGESEWTDIAQEKVRWLDDDVQDQEDDEKEEEVTKPIAADGTTKKKRDYCSIDDESDSEEEQEWKDPGDVRESEENNRSVFDKAVEEDEDDDWIVTDVEDEDEEAGSKENRKQVSTKVKNIVEIARHQQAKVAAVTSATGDAYIMEVPDVVTSQRIEELSNEEKDDYEVLQRLYLEKQTRTGSGAELPGDMRLRRMVRPARIEAHPDLKRKIEDLNRRKLHGERYRLLKLLRNYETYPLKFGGAIPTDLTPGRSFNDNEDVQEVVQLDNNNDEVNMVTEVIDVDEEGSVVVDQLLVKKEEIIKEVQTKIGTFPSQCFVGAVPKDLTPDLSLCYSENVQKFKKRKVLVKEEPCDDNHNNINSSVVTRVKKEAEKDDEVKAKVQDMTNAQRIPKYIDTAIFLQQQY